MRETPIKFSEASARYPAEVAVIMKKLSAGTHKLGNAGTARLQNARAKPNQLTWSLRWGVKPLMADRCRSLDIEERRAEEVRRLKHIILVGSISEWEGTSIVGMNHALPSEISDKIYDDVELAVAEEARQLGMTTAEMEDELRKATDPERLKAVAKIERLAKSLFAERFNESGLVEIAVDAGKTEQLFNDFDAAFTAFLLDFVEPLKEN